MRVLGISSGTSLDAIDVALGQFTQDGETLRLLKLGHAERPWPPQLRADLLGVYPPNQSDVGTWCRLDTLVGQAFGEAAVWAINRFDPADLIASHGQTIFHWACDGQVRGTLQLGSPAWIHAATEVSVVSDFRVADIAAGGQGAPLASTLDQLWLGDELTAALNLGGIANVSIVGGEQVVAGDTGPANCLLDAAANELGMSADLDGKLARAGRVDEDALRRLLADPYYQLAFPKSTGREYFHSRYVRTLLGERTPEGADLLTTLTELTARTVADAINGSGVTRVVASGGGLGNPFLMERLRALVPVRWATTDELGMPAAAKEAYLFALLGLLIGARAARNRARQGRASGHRSHPPSGVG